MSEFQFSLGDRVACMLAIEEMQQYFARLDTAPSLHMLTVEERISIECIGGTQRFYTCRDWRGALEKHPESALVPVRVMLDAWADGIDAQHANEDTVRQGRR